MTGSLVLAFGAGVLSLLSPCTLPILPIVVAAALGAHKYGALALAAGLALAFATIGVVLTLAGQAVPVSEAGLRIAAAVGLLLVGVLLIVPPLQVRLTILLAPLQSALARRFGHGTGTGSAGQFGLGLLLGGVWAPCVGPTLGAAMLLASRGERLGDVAAIMLAFGLGAGGPLVALGLIPQARVLRLRQSLAVAGHRGRQLLALVLVGLAVLTGLDKTLEAALVKRMPAWLLDLTTRL